MHWKKETAGLIILLFACSAVAEDSTSLGGLLKEVKKNGAATVALRGEIDEKIGAIEETLGAKIDYLFARIALIVLSVHLFVLGAVKTIGGIKNYFIERKKIKQKDKAIDQLDEIIRLLKRPGAIKILDKADEIEKAKIKRTVSKKGGFLCILIGSLISAIIFYIISGGSV